MRLREKVRANQGVAVILSTASHSCFTQLYIGFTCGR
jgi:hypothetical protein